MHSRCCWPPESRSAGWSRLSVTSSSSPARASASWTAPRRSRLRPPGGLLAQHVRDVVEHAHRERVRLLEDHRHAAAQRGRLHLGDVHSVERDPAAVRAVPSRQLGEAVERAQQRRLAAARGADQREHLALADRQRDGVDGELRAVGDRQRPRPASGRSRWPSELDAARGGDEAEPAPGLEGARPRGRCRSCRRGRRRRERVGALRGGRRYRRSCPVSRRTGGGLLSSIAASSRGARRRRRRG